MFQQNLASVEGIVWSEKYKKQYQQSINKIKSTESFSSSWTTEITIVVTPLVKLVSKNHGRPGCISEMSVQAQNYRQYLKQDCSNQPFNKNFPFFSKPSTIYYAMHTRRIATYLGRQSTLIRWTYPLIDNLSTIICVQVVK